MSTIPKAAVQIKVDDVIERTFQYKDGILTDFLRVLEVGVNPHGHLYFKMLSNGGLQIREDFFHTDIIQLLE